MQRFSAQDLKRKNMVWFPKKSISHDKDIIEAKKKRLAHGMGKRKDVSANALGIESTPKATESKGAKFIGSVTFVHGDEEIPVNDQLTFIGGKN